MSAQDAILDFVRFMEANGVKPVEPIASRLGSGNLIRFRCDGDGKGRLNGWAILYLDERPAGAFGNYRLNTGTLKWKADSNGPVLSQEERQALQREWQQAKGRREAEQRANERQAALDAAAMWDGAGMASPDHGYVQRKRLQTAFLRQTGSTLLVPMYAEDGCLWNLQRIAPDGTKRFLRGGRVADLFCFVGEFGRDATQAVITEGYATADAVNQASGLPAIAAFSAKNMIRIARLWKERRPDLEYTIFGDDDRATEAATGNNPGREAAFAAAREIGAKIAFPVGEAA